MSPQIPLVPIEEENSDLTFTYLEGIFAALSSVDALNIFYAAEDGIESSTQTIKELNLTQKRYYTNLKRLIDAGLVERVNGRYVHTTFGKIVHKLIEALKNAVDQKEKLDLIDRILKVKNLSEDEAKEIISVLLKDVNLIPDGYITDTLGPVRIIENWERAVQEIMKAIYESKEKILFACRYHDIRLVEACLATAQRNVKIRFLIDEELKTSRTAQILLRILFNDTSTGHISGILESSDFQIRYAYIPYSFLIADGEYVMLEVPIPTHKRFFFAFFFHNKRIAEKLSSLFKDLWKESSDTEMNQERGFSSDGSIQRMS